ncbi:MAG: ParA family protein [Coriobacteriia bacterium]|nr:ParA family protein [Coriobacteriia bacterium]
MRIQDMPLVSTIELPPLTIVAGHYGVGKTNLALNLALMQRRALGVDALTLIDLDIVNPYFRSGNYEQGLQSLGISFLGPVHGASNLDTPSLMPGIAAALAAASSEHPVIIDVGGDADGARALARFVPQITAQPEFWFIYVANSSRPEVDDPEKALAILREIERVSGLCATHIAGNTHLKEQTSPETIISSLPYLEKLAELTKLPLAFVAVPHDCLLELAQEEGLEAQEKPPTKTPAAHASAAKTPAQTPPLFPVDILVGCSWEDVRALIV